jgi:hypothetical protein
MTTKSKRTFAGSKHAQLKAITKLVNRKPSETTRAANAAAAKTLKNAPKHPARPE